ncbi:MAG: glutathione S-transferase family protein [Rhodobacteraceae bacterium]|uniref:glutathione S-transferase family protein n=1 Tax=Amaricoccus sp. TaxID=1872485 RepID=UPI001D8A702F|nr:glutathione S-transferase family protein [Amaricoccus sp.]MCB1374060.1 glutathione S-transferase family protein [Paracoccaceae bacterium]MCB1402326.1 glutathione S-transferase family protein [Paracoccaceae bacterium]HRW13750.1 glutathione S-transferase family protein [Amaricoccus sp.]
MSKPIVTYFDFSGSRGEEVRLALVLAGMAFEDNRISRETFAQLKPDLPFAAVPTLELEGRGVFGQSNAILRLIGRKHGLYPEDPFEAARHDALMDAAEDLRHRIMPTARIADAAERKAARRQLADEYLPQWGRCVERAIGAGPFVGGERPGVADIKLSVVDRWISGGVLDDIPADLFDAFPRLKTVAAGIRSHPAVVAWYATPA